MWRMKPTNSEHEAEPKPPTPEYASFEEEVADGTQNNQDEEVDEEAFNTNNHKF
jgi:hypothetical protein